MIKKITNWTFGSIFRTIGRFLAYIIIGIIISLIFLKKDNVNALTYTTEVYENGTTIYDVNNTSDFTCQSWDSCEFEMVSSDSNPIGQKTFYFNRRNDTNAQYQEFQLLISQPVQIAGVDSTLYPVCTQWQQNGNSYTCTSITSVTGGTALLQDSMLQDMNISFKVFLANGNWTYCDLSGSKVTCPTWGSQITALEVTWNFKTHWTSYVLFRLNTVAKNLYASSIQQVIENQENNTQQIIQSQENATQQQIEANQVCKHIDKSSIKENKILYPTGSTENSTVYGLTDYINIVGAKIKVLENFNTASAGYCFYDINKVKISCENITATQPGNYVTIPNNATYFRTPIQLTSNKPQYEICQNGNQALNNSITGEVSGSGENGTITDEDAMQSSCGIICKLKHLIQTFSIGNLKYLIVPTEDQMNELFTDMQEKITSKIGILGLPVTIYTRLMQIAMQYQEGGENWCFAWEGIPVPNFEEYNIIEGGQWCYSDILQNQKINTFRNTCMYIIGALIVLSFIQYLYNCLHRILDVPIQENYEYITTEDVINYDTFTGEVKGRQHRTRTTRRVEVDN